MMPDWSSLPAEIHTIILQFLVRNKNIGHCAAVSREWRSVIEENNFRHLKLNPLCLKSLELLSEHPKGLIRHIWLNIELIPYTCRCCREWESPKGRAINDVLMAHSITWLFTILANWKRDEGGLTLELNAYSPSDSEHWFKNCYFGATGEDEDELELLNSGYQPQDGGTAIHDPSHGWWHGHMIEAPNDDALRRPFEPALLSFSEELPAVPVATKFLLRRQCRRQIVPTTLSHIWSKLPRLQEIRYEPWQLQEKDTQEAFDIGRRPHDHATHYKFGTN